MTQAQVLKQKKRKRQRRKARYVKAISHDREVVAQKRHEIQANVKRKDAQGKAIAKLDALIKKNLDKNPVVKGNVVTGGTPRGRLVAAAEKAAYLSATGERRSFYSQAGAWTVKYGITGEPSGYRSDCSQWVTSIYYACGLPDPNGTNYTGGYTGTLGSHGREIGRGELRPGDLVCYGPYPHHHVEMYVGPDPHTIGHGSAPVDAGTIDMLSDEKHYYTYL